MRLSLPKDLHIQTAIRKPTLFFPAMVLLMVLSTGCSWGESTPKISSVAEESDAEAAGLIGRVKTVRVERATFSKRGGLWTEIPRQFISTTRYNEKGDTIEELFYQPNGLPAMKVIYTYDSKGRHAEEAVFKGESSRSSRLVYHHDESGRLIEKVIYNVEGALDWKVGYTYDDKGNKKEVVVSQADGSLSARRLYRYDAEGNEIEEGVYSGETLVSRGVFGHDGKGNRIKETFFLPKGTVSAEYVQTYEFDAAGNWIKRSRSGVDLGSGKIDFEHSESTYRTIGYY
jgi:hypothetical protein